MLLYPMVSDELGRCLYRHECERVMDVLTGEFLWARKDEIREVGLRTVRTGFDRDFVYEIPDLEYRGRAVTRMVTATTSSYTMWGRDTDHRVEVDEVVPASIWPQMDELIAPRTTGCREGRDRQRRRMYRLRRAWEERDYDHEW